MEELAAQSSTSSSNSNPKETTCQKLYSVLTSSGCLENRSLWKFCALSHPLLALRKDASVLRNSLHSSTAKQREEICLMGLVAVRKDNLEQLEALVSSDTLRVHWHLNKDDKGRALHDTDLAQVAALHGACRCLRALLALRPVLASPKRMLLDPQKEERTLLPSLRILLETKQLDPNGTIEGVPWLLCSLRRRRFHEASLLMEMGAAVDVWDYSYSNREDWQWFQSISGESPLHSVVRFTAQTDLMKQIVEGAKKAGCLDWVGSSREKRDVIGSPLLLVAQKISESPSLSEHDLNFVKELVGAGANVRLTDKQGLTAVHLISKKGEKTAFRAAETADSVPMQIPVVDCLLSCEPSLLNAGPLVPVPGGKFGRRCRYTAVIAAAEGGQWGLVKALLERGTDVDGGRGKNAPFETLLHLAAATAPPSVLALIVSRAKVVNTEVEVGAASGGSREMKEFLSPEASQRICLAGGKFDKLKLTPLAFAIRFHQQQNENLPETQARIRAIAESKDVDLSRVAVRIFENGKEKEGIFNALAWSVVTGQIETALWLHEKYPQLPLFPEEVMAGDPQLLLKGSLELLEYALSCVKEEGEGGKQKEAVRLLSVCAHLNAAPFLPHLLELAEGPGLCKQEFEKEGTVLHLASRVGSVGVLSVLLKQERWDPNLVSESLDGSTPMMEAAKAPLRETEDSDTSFRQTVDLLVEAGAQVLRKDQRGRTALMLAVEVCPSVSEGGEGQSPLGRERKRVELLTEVCGMARMGEKGLHAMGEAMAAAVKRDARAAVEVLASSGGEPLVRHVVETHPEVFDSVRDSAARRGWLGLALLNQCSERSVQCVETKGRVVQAVGDRGVMDFLLRKALRLVLEEEGGQRVSESGSCVDCDFVAERCDLSGLQSGYRWGLTKTADLYKELRTLELFRIPFDPHRHAARSHIVTYFQEMRGVLKDIEDMRRTDPGKADKREGDVKRSLASDLQQYADSRKEKGPEPGDLSFTTRREVFDNLDRIVQEEGEWWDRKNDTETLQLRDIPAGSEYDSVRAIHSTLTEQAEKIKDAHVNALRWCLENVKTRFDRLCQEKAESVQPFEYSDATSDFWEILQETGDPPSSSTAASCASPPSLPSSASCSLNPNAFLNLQIFRVVRRLMAKAKKAVKGWTGKPQLCFPLTADCLSGGSPSASPDAFGQRRTASPATAIQSKTAADQKEDPHTPSSCAPSRTTTLNFYSAIRTNRATEASSNTQPAPCPSLKDLDAYLTDETKILAATPERLPDLVSRRDPLTGMKPLASPAEPPSASPGPETHVCASLSASPVSQTQSRHRPRSILVRRSFSTSTSTASTQTQTAAASASSSSTSSKTVTPCPSSSSPSISISPSQKDLLAAETAASLGGEGVSVPPKEGGQAVTQSGRQGEEESGPVPLGVSASVSRCTPILPSSEFGGLTGQTMPMPSLFAFGGEEATPAVSLFSGRDADLQKPLFAYRERRLFEEQKRTPEGDGGGLTKPLFDFSALPPWRQGGSASSPSPSVPEGGAVQCEENEPAEVSDALPLSVLSLEDKARCMMYRSWKEFRDDLTCLWQNSHSFHGDRDTSASTLAAWTLMKWGQEMVDALQELGEANGGGGGRFFDSKEKEVAPVASSRVIHIPAHLELN